MWYVLNAESDAHLISGFEHEVSEGILRDSVANEAVEKHLHKEAVHGGDLFFFPEGTVHGIGDGVLRAEIQESSNVTYRVYDYNRLIRMATNVNCILIRL